MQGPKEIAIGIAQAVRFGPNPLPLQLRDMALQDAGELMVLIITELNDAGIEIEKIELPPAWLAETDRLLKASQSFSLEAAGHADERQIRIFKRILA